MLTPSAATVLAQIRPTVPSLPDGELLHKFDRSDFSPNDQNDFIIFVPADWI